MKKSELKSGLDEGVTRHCIETEENDRVFIFSIKSNSVTL